MEIAIKNAMALARSTLSPFERKDGWDVDFSDRENSIYFHNHRTNKTHWESPTSGVKFPVPRGYDEAGCGRLARKYQVPIIPNFPKGLKRPRTPEAATFTKDIKRGEDRQDTSKDVKKGGDTQETLQIDEEEKFRGPFGTIHDTSEEEPPRKIQKKDHEMKLDNISLDDSTTKTKKDNIQNNEKEVQNKSEEMFEFPDDVWYYRNIGGGLKNGRDKKVTLPRKKKLIQQNGGFIAALAAPVLGILGDLIIGGIRRGIAKRKQRKQRKIS
ncbi:uncharacterized protein LOC121416842 [Lytechinus variegatus]|uniref:uncharacterized protein LOC121416842 n=1 Tax=Lytechinus variegatus TaxID=7654 RepID=UPI001BB0F89B|nr:uncharacterized protein LOC121416842 [Lytechinus variegatus]